jgi:hypothetical protein
METRMSNTDFLIHSLDRDSVCRRLLGRLLSFRKKCRWESRKIPRNVFFFL